MNRRRLLTRATMALLSPLLGASCAPSRMTGVASAGRTLRRVRPADPDWPDAAAWEGLSRRVGSRLVAVRSPLAECARAPESPACAETFRRLANPYYLGDEPGLTQTLGWAGAWTSRPSAYAVAARTSADVVAAVQFAREHRLRLVVKGGGHSYLGTSNAPDSVLVWTRAMNAIDRRQGGVPTQRFAD